MKKIQCQGKDCGGMAEEVDEEYYACGYCGWAGSEDNPVLRYFDIAYENSVSVLEKQLEELKSDLRDCHDLLNDCGFFYENGIWVDGDNREGEE